MAVSTKRDHAESSDEGKAAKAQAEANDSTAQDVAELVADEQAQGFRGLKVDPTPNENYTVAGVTSGAPTPETDEGAADAAAKAQKDTAATAAGVAKR